MLNDWIDRKQFCRPGVSIKSVAKEIGINNNYLSKYLNNVLGITFHQWLHNLRIEEAKVLMKEQAFLCNPSIEGEAGRFIVNQMWSVSEFNKSLLPIKR